MNAAAHAFLTGGGQAHRDAGETETAARDRIAPKVGQLKARVLHALTEAGEQGLTATEATEAIGYTLDRLYSVAPRLPELVRGGYAAVTARRGDRQVYVATAAGIAWAEQVAA